MGSNLPIPAGVVVVGPVPVGVDGLYSALLGRADLPVSPPFVDVQVGWSEKHAI